MSLQAKDLLKDNGAKSMRVLELLSPLQGDGAPAENATFVGQTYVDTTVGNVYVAVATDSVAPADDWVQTNA